MLLILVCMVLLLVGLQHYMLKGQRHGEMDDSLSDTLRRQIDNESGVISRYNVFHRFFAEDDDFSDSSVPRFFQAIKRGAEVFQLSQAERLLIKHWYCSCGLHDIMSLIL